MTRLQTWKTTKNLNIKDGYAHARATHPCVNGMNYGKLDGRRLKPENDLRNIAKKGQYLQTGRRVQAERPRSG